MTDGPGVTLLGAAEIRELAARHGIRPTKQWGQNFVVDGNTVRRIVRVAGVGAGDTVVEVGPGLGSLTLALLPVVDRVVAVEVDPVLAEALPGTVALHAPTLADRLEVVAADALAVRRPARPAAHGPRRQPALQRLGPRRAALPRALPEPAHDPRHGAARGRRAARRAAGVAHLRRAERQGRLVRRRASRGVGLAQRLLAGAQRRLRPGDASPGASRRRPPPAARRSSPVSTRPSPSAARRCGRPWPPGPGRRCSPRRRSWRPASTPAPVVSSSTSTAFAAIAVARAAAGPAGPSAPSGPSV